MISGSRWQHGEIKAVDIVVGLSGNNGYGINDMGINITSEERRK